MEFDEQPANAPRFGVTIFTLISVSSREKPTRCLAALVASLTDVRLAMSER